MEETMQKSDSFETWIRFTVPWQLNLSPSKQVAMQHWFYQFESVVCPLQKKCPEEFKTFFEALQSKMEEVSKWKAPKGTKIIPVVADGKLNVFPNCKIMYDLKEKK
jgi:hypothetical protein